MTKYRRWTKEEDDTLVQLIRANPQSLSFSIKETAKVLNRSVNSVRSRYHRLTNPYCKCYKGVNILTPEVETFQEMPDIVKVKEVTLLGKVKNFFKNLFK